MSQHLRVQKVRWFLTESHLYCLHNLETVLYKWKKWSKKLEAHCRSAESVQGAAKLTTLNGPNSWNPQKDGTLLGQQWDLESDSTHHQPVGLTTKGRGGNSFGQSSRRQLWKQCQDLQIFWEQSQDLPNHPHPQGMAIDGLLMEIHISFHRFVILCIPVSLRVEWRIHTKIWWTYYFPASKLVGHKGGLWHASIAMKLPTFPQNDPTHVSLHQSFL